MVRVSACVGKPSGLSAVCTAIGAVPVLIKFRMAFCSLLSISKLAMNLNQGKVCRNSKLSVLA